MNNTKERKQQQTILKFLKPIEKRIEFLRNYKTNVILINSKGKYGWQEEIKHLEEYNRLQNNT